jgi:hypothetical protein
MSRGSGWSLFSDIDSRLVADRRDAQWEKIGLVFVPQVGAVAGTDSHVVLISGMI